MAGWLPLFRDLAEVEVELECCVHPVSEVEVEWRAGYLSSCVSSPISPAASLGKVTSLRNVGRLADWQTSRLADWLDTGIKTGRLAAQVSRLDK